MAKREYPEWMGKMRGLKKEEIKEFLAGPVVARVATVKPDGSPYVAPVWQEFDGEAIYFIPRERSAFVSHIKANPRVAISCALDTAPYTRVLFEGKAEILEGPSRVEGKVLEMGQRMSRRYLGEHGPEYLEPTRDRPRFLVRVIPDKITSWEGVEWHEKYVA